MQAALYVTAVLIGLAGKHWQEYVVSLQGAGAPAKIVEVSEKLDLLPKGNGQILTLSPEIAVSAHLKLVPGYEMGTFSYFPQLDDARTKQLHVVNAARLERDLTDRRASILALTTDSLYVFARGLGRAGLSNLIASRYDLAGVVKGYGQYSETLYLFTENTRAP